MVLAGLARQIRSGAPIPKPVIYVILPGERVTLSLASGMTFIL